MILTKVSGEGWEARDENSSLLDIQTTIGKKGLEREVGLVSVLLLLYRSSQSYTRLKRRQEKTISNSKHLHECKTHTKNREVLSFPSQVYSERLRVWEYYSNKRFIRTTVRHLTSNL